jgi:hypothetical protein
MSRRCESAGGFFCRIRFADGPPSANGPILMGPNSEQELVAAEAWQRAPPGD